MVLGGGHASRSGAAPRSAPASEWITGVAAEEAALIPGLVLELGEEKGPPAFPCVPKIENTARKTTSQDPPQDFLPAGSPCFWPASRDTSHKLTCIFTSQRTPTSPAFSPEGCASLSSISSCQVCITWAWHGPLGWTCTC